MTINEVIRREVKRWIKKHGGNAASINDGECDTFAEIITKKVPEAKALWDHNMDRKRGSCRDFIHCFIKYEGRFYDSETPDGVDDWIELPCFIRERAKV